MFSNKKGVFIGANKNDDITSNSDVTNNINQSDQILFSDCDNYNPAILYDHNLHMIKKCDGYLTITTKEGKIVDCAIFCHLPSQCTSNDCLHGDCPETSDYCLYSCDDDYY